MKNPALFERSGPQPPFRTDPVTFIPVDLLVPGKSQPRTHFDSEGISQLAQSIQSFGIIQPLLVTPAKDGKFEIIAGERRWRAARSLSLKEVPCLVRKNEEDEDPLELALIENIQRRDLSPIEEAHAIADLLSNHHHTHDELSVRLGIPRTSLSNTLRLLQLPEFIKDLIHQKKISTGHAKVLLTVDDELQKRNLAELVVKKGLSVRKTEEIAKSFESGKKNGPKPGAQIQPNLRHLCDQYKGHLGTKVKITGDHEKGRIEISYYSQEDLDRITELVLGDISG